MTMAMKFNINVCNVEVKNYSLASQQSISYVTIGLLLEWISVHFSLCATA